MHEVLDLKEEDALSDQLMEKALAIESLYTRIIENGVVSQEEMQYLDSVIPGALPARYPVKSFTARPSRVNLSVAVEAVTLQTATLIATLAAAIVTLISKIIEWITGGSSSSSSSSGGGSSKTASKISKNVDDFSEAYAKFVNVVEELKPLEKDLAAFPSKRYDALLSETNIVEERKDDKGYIIRLENPIPTNYITWYIFSDKNDTGFDVFGSNYPLAAALRDQTLALMKGMDEANKLLDSFSPETITEFNTKVANKSEEIFSNIIGINVKFFKACKINFNETMFEFGNNDLTPKERFDYVDHVLMSTFESNNDGIVKKISAVQSWAVAYNSGYSESVVFCNFERALSRVAYIHGSKFFTECPSDISTVIKDLGKTSVNADKLIKKSNKIISENGRELSPAQQNAMFNLVTGINEGLKNVGRQLKVLDRLTDTPSEIIIRYNKFYSKLLTGVKKWIEEGRPSE